LKLIVLTDGCTTSQCDKTKTESNEATEKNYSHNKPWLCTRKFTNMEIWGKIMIPKDGRRKERGTDKNHFSVPWSMHCQKYNYTYLKKKWYTDELETSSLRMEAARNSKSLKFKKRTNERRRNVNELDEKINSRNTFKLVILFDL
jgi:hypothetical protein